ncbi:MAG: DNA repair protein RadC [Patescibacteria group bacterium]|nr:MAG: DNA repair protein RadC [Patescibacteria group bacterium]
MKTAYSLITKDIILDERTVRPLKEYILKIKDMPSDDRPRERLAKHGPSSLSIAELMAIILGNGTKKEEVMAMTARIVKEYGEKALSNQQKPKVLAEELDIPLGKAMQIVACAELGRRFFDKPSHGPVVIRTAKDVYDYLIDLRNLPKEHLRGLYLNTHHRLIHDEIISIGTINSNLIHPREVFKPAVEYGAAAVVLAHNHPSGIVTPSKADIEITNHVIAAGEIIGIPLVDHVIIGPDSFASIEADYRQA